MADDHRPPRTTTDAGIPAASDEHSLTVGPDGPILLQDHYLIQKMAQFNRERVPERVVHAKGGAAHGFFEVTEDVTPYTKADFLSKVGKRTDVFLRFSTVAGELGSADTVRDPRGFAIKFYTDEGNYDLVGNNTPIFFVRDPSKFQDFIHSQKRMPVTNRRSNDAQWDFWTLSPESAHQVTFLMTDRGTPRTWRHMHGFGSHTFLWVNAGGERFWVKYHLKTAQGVENFTDAEAKALVAEEPDFHLRDLFDAIKAGDAPEWHVEMQIMPFEEAADYRFNPFDLTKVWPHGDYPPITVGRLVLDRNPENYFAEVEQAAFEPANMVPGIGPSPDKMLLGRLFSYPDTHRHRIGTNYQQLPINQPKAPVHSYNKDGAMRSLHSGDQPVYAPNSHGGPRADPALEDAGWAVGGAEMVRNAYTLRRDDDDFGQPGTLWREVLSETDRDHLVDNIVGHLSNEVTDPVVARAVAYWSAVDPQLGARVAAGLGRGDGAGNGASEHGRPAQASAPSPQA
ncbi:MAG: catalase [Solirubrobacteraceae bacterium]|jgi:catalase|nr:catalase [Solirubrobacteraceae bacterium]